MNQFCRIALLAAVFILAREASADSIAYRDCPNCPEMVTIPAGSFLMQSNDGVAGETPDHQVTISAAFALGKFEVTVGEFRRFVLASGYRTEAEKNTDIAACHAMDGYNDKSYRYWDRPGFTQTDQQPVACISLNDAQAYVKWLGETTGKAYRLPNETEWEYAARAGTTTSRYWGDDPNQACLYANVADQSTGPNAMDGNARHECNDGYHYTAPVGTYKPNAFGLHDMIGNVWEWVEGNKHNDAPTDDKVLSADGTERVLRGGSWFNGPQLARAAASVNEVRDRNGLPMFRTLNCMGFRVASMLP